MAIPQEEQIIRWCCDSIPPDSDTVYQLLCETNGLFRLDEGSSWDFKATWPFSLSDDYFGGLVRAICAFSNSRGGLLVFGVHDKHRTGGHNKVTINFDRFRQAVRQLIGIDIPMSIRSYDHLTIGDIAVLFIPPRPLGVRPYTFQRTLGKYPSRADSDQPVSYPQALK